MGDSIRPFSPSILLSDSSGSWLTPINSLGLVPSQNTRQTTLPIAHCIFIIVSLFSPSSHGLQWDSSARCPPTQKSHSQQSNYPTGTSLGDGRELEHRTELTNSPLPAFKVRWKPWSHQTSTSTAAPPCYFPWGEGVKLKAGIDLT